MFRPVQQHESPSQTFRMLTQYRIEAIYLTKAHNLQTIGSVTHRPEAGRIRDNVGSLALVLYAKKIHITTHGWTHRAVVGIMPATGRWVTDLMVCSLRVVVK